MEVEAFVGEPLAVAPEVAGRTVRFGAPRARGPEVVGSSVGVAAGGCAYGAGTPYVEEAFVLLGERQKQVQDWNEARKHLGPNFFERITNFDTSKATKKILKRVVVARKLIEGLDENAVSAASEALSGIFKWVACAADALESVAALAMASGNGELENTITEEEEEDEEEDEFDKDTEKLIAALVNHHQMLMSKYLEDRLQKSTSLTSA